MIEKFHKAEEIRNIKKSSHKLIKEGIVDVRYQLAKASEKVYCLEQRLKSIHNIRERKKALKEMQNSSERLHMSMILKEKVIQTTKEQDAKFFHRTPDSKKSKVFLPSLGKTNDEPIDSMTLNSSSIMKSLSKSPQYQKKYLNYFSPGKCVPRQSVF